MKVKSKKSTASATTDKNGKAKRASVVKSWLREHDYSVAYSMLAPDDAKNLRRGLKAEAKIAKLQALKDGVASIKAKLDKLNKLRRDAMK